MPKDAKFGLILGVGLVIVIAVLFFGKNPSEPNKSDRGKATSLLHSKGQIETAATHSPEKSSPITSAGNAHRSSSSSGEIPPALARQFRREDSQSVEFVQKKRDPVALPDRLITGTSLLPTSNDESAATRPASADQ